MPLFHVSDAPDIACFTPRAVDGAPPAVWAIDAPHLPNYLLPRDCPRICVRANPGASEAQRMHWLKHTDHAIYVEFAWRDRIDAARLFIYEFTIDGFVCVDANAGYFQSRDAVAPRRVSALRDLPTALRERRIELRYVESLWPLHDVVETSGLSFSCIRMRHATPRNDANR